jgi:hypothetical protein
MNTILGCFKMENKMDWENYIFPTMIRRVPATTKASLEMV